jgi:hypothetical protein
MNPELLLGMKYRLGSNPVDHGTADCLSLTRAVLTWYDVPTPEPQRSWYRRLRQNDYAVFKEELERWGTETVGLDSGVVALCKTDNGNALASYWEEGWLSFVGSEVAWSPIGALEVCALYCPRK